MSSALTTFVFVPGAFCPGSYYHKVIAKLEALGYEAVALDLPSVGPKPESKPATGYEDASYVNSKVTELLNQGKNVVLGANSYGGFVVTEASKGLSKAEREAAGKPGALIHLVLMGSFLTPVGKTVKDMLTGHIPLDFESEVEYIDSGPAEIAGYAFFGSLPQEDQMIYGGQTKPHSAASFRDPLTHAGYEHIPTTVVIGELDRAYSPKVQHENVDAVIAKGVGQVKKVVLPVDHIPMLAHPDEIVSVLLGAAT
ncbi:alpha/beta-hydrolase [Lindgomyces ingoldianus]|uniref:Alpha/beta-hydrolase n=1 Tax=Lindgomyces ingoldianus TaxID=673940 RepID=A0ACB6QM31_9PLEO|nr:alpha/beta-hydrolase [Lindgomyces ingoldianus]KAF2467182.1 alpha/beta-hydrolase [Lindgomyces ingoldianus]